MFLLKFCQTGYFYDPSSAYCAPQSEFGETCFAQNQCQSGLVCSTEGALKNICLKDIGGTCGADDECINLLPCLYGICTCFVN